MGKAIIFFLIFVSLSSIAIAQNYRWLYNPYTAKLDRSLSLNQSGYGIIADNFTGDHFGDGGGLTGISAGGNCSASNSCAEIVYSNNGSFVPANQEYNTSEDMIRAVNQTGLFYDIKITWANILNKFIESVQSKWFYMIGTEITFNETKLKEQIDANITSISPTR